ncbi:TauD/TfdA family dioxygenase [Coralliovum pocilloporae]|uniref:TauD/TfdA family dioxygenase n=1 Tax=Coralliovum pocilloporae TaxID=3066369 RepID=UPI003306B5B1
MTFQRDLPPRRLDCASAWQGSTLQEQPDLWTTHFSEADVSELEQAAEHFERSGRDIASITRESFPLPHLETRLADLRETLVEGLGFHLFRGLPVERLSRLRTAIIFCGLGAYIGSARSQNAAGHLLGHVRDTGADAKDPKTRIYQTAERQTFHTDSADVVGLLCINEAREGGDSLIVSVATLYNEMMRCRRELVPILFDPIATDRRGEVPEGEKPFFDIPVLNWHDEHLTGTYQRQYIDSAQRFAEAPRLSEAQIQALDLFDDLANDPALHLRMRLQPGDIQFVYNHALLHDRTGFTDWPEPDKRRHLLRLWLSVPGDRQLPECFRQRFGSIEPGNRGGIITRETQLSVPLD